MSLCLGCWWSGHREKSLDPPAWRPAKRCGPGRDLGTDGCAQDRMQTQEEGLWGRVLGGERTGDQRRGAQPGVSYAVSARTNRQKALHAALGGGQ